MTTRPRVAGPSSTADIIDAMEGRQGGDEERCLVFATALFFGTLVKRNSGFVTLAGWPGLDVPFVIESIVEGALRLLIIRAVDGLDGGHEFFLGALDVLAL